jgi:MerR family transcriptional regulator, mercuric resistance operon regulatory protein
MSAYTVSRLALDAGVSVHIVRDYLLRGLLRPVACTPGGYGLFDDAALQRLCFVRAAFEAGNRKELWMVQPNRRERRFQIRPQEVGLARPIPGDESAR